MMFNLITMLVSTLNTEPYNSTDQKIARFILENIEAAHSYSITDLAKECYVSPASISRFSRNIGFSDFSDLKAQWYQLPLHRQEKFVYPQKDSLDHLSTYVDGIIHSLLNLKNSIDISLIIELVEDLISYQNVCAFGSQQSEHVVLNLQSDLYSSGKLIDTSLKFNHQIQYLNDTNKEDLIIIFSYNGQYLRRAFAHGLKFNLLSKPKIYMISCQADIPLTKYVDKVIHVPCIKSYASHPYIFEVIRALISMEYSHCITKHKNHL